MDGIILCIYDTIYLIWLLQKTVTAYFFTERFVYDTSHSSTNLRTALIMYRCTQDVSLGRFSWPLCPQYEKE